MKHDLTKATFIIPIKIETEDRLRNVITSICFLLSNFDTTVMVKEVDDTSIFLEDALPQIVEFCENTDGLLHSFEDSKGSLSFHRQRVLNDMIMESKTEVVVNYDCDILLPISSYLNAYNSIIEKKFDVMYPYGDGDYQYRVMADDQLVSDFLNNEFDFSILEKKSIKHDAKYGFCQFLQRDVYIEGGLENENFVAYAPEDVERFYRFGALGYTIGRMDTMVYHLEHGRTPNSWFTNPYMDENNREWERVQKMDSETLREYITSQDYYKQRIDGQK